MKYQPADHTPEQNEALTLVQSWAPRFFDALLKQDNGRYTAEAAAARLDLTNAEGHLRPLHLISEMISKDPAFAANVIACDQYIRNLQADPANIGSLLEQQHELLDSALDDHDAELSTKAAQRIRLINAVVAERSRGISPAAIHAQGASRGEGLAL